MTQYNFIIYIKPAYLLFMLTSLFLLACNDSEYSKLVHEEMAKNINHDTLIFEMKFGDTKKVFFEQCWNLNKKGLVKEGPDNKFVQYILKTDKSDGYDIRMLFYGLFDKQDEMCGMDMEFSYLAHGPLNKHLNAKNLSLAVQDTIQEWFPGNQFIRLNLKLENKEAFAKVDGNRRIVLYNRNEKDVIVKITNLNKMDSMKLN